MGNTSEVSIDIGNNAEGEFFDNAVQPVSLVAAEAINRQSFRRHLLLMVRQAIR
ncbi:MAG: hypothetical protein P8L85_11410 [Rubripirellula sp.]|nr:hypothetical protein [Rubripirellula sp.]